ncbi:Villin-like protein [Galemys pyrenaicus]|uniref:Villin-like protein n=1 Tax=Galemys pyrenaicus TaxID=202257 RepID=A0A8J6AGH3_GALPY|nr:Villin-like protein [Galemys pyrenaicus]
MVSFRKVEMWHPQVLCRQPVDPKQHGQFCVGNDYFVFHTCQDIDHVQCILYRCQGTNRYKTRTMEVPVHSLILNSSDIYLLCQHDMVQMMVSDISGKSKEMVLESHEPPRCGRGLPAPATRGFPRCL